jgi:hypothetical protein
MYSGSCRHGVIIRLTAAIILPAAAPAVALSRRMETFLFFYIFL